MRIQAGIVPMSWCARVVQLSRRARRVVQQMTVLENIAMGAIPPSDIRTIHDSLEWVTEPFPKHRERSSQYR